MVGHPTHYGDIDGPRHGSTHQSPSKRGREKETGQALTLQAIWAVLKPKPFMEQISSLEPPQSNFFSVEKREVPNLQVLRAELVSVHVDSREEYGLHLVVPQLIGGQVRGDEHLQEER